MSNGTGDYRTYRRKVIELLQKVPLIRKAEAERELGIRHLLSAFKAKKNDPVDYRPEVIVLEYVGVNAILALRNYKELFSAAEIESARSIIFSGIATDKQEAGLRGVQTKQNKNGLPFRKQANPIHRTESPSLLTLLEEYRNARTLP